MTRGPRILARASGLYGLAVACVSAAVALTRLAWPVFQGTPLVPIFGSIVAATHWGNRRAGQFAILLGLLGAKLAVPPGGPSPWNPRTVIVFTIIGILSNLVVDGRNRVEAALRASLAAQKRTEEELLAKEAHLRRAQKTEAVAQLVAGVAHNFNNLLTVTMGHAELLMEHNGGREPEQTDLQLIHDAAERGAALTRQLLAFGRQHAATVRQLDMSAAISGWGEVLAQTIREDIRLEIARAPEPVFVEIDPGDLEQIVLNLVLNARDALPTGGIVRVEVDTLRVDAPGTAHGQSFAPGEYARLRVRDNGSGMAPDVEAHLFEPFFTTKDVGQGTGLGLAFVYGIAQQRGGFVIVETAPGQGTTVAVHFPIVAAGKAETGVRAPGAAAAPAGKSATILLVEDEDAVRKVTEGMLNRAGYRVLSAATPREASGIFDAHAAEIDLLVSDVVMPETHGPELARQFASRRPDLRVLFVSGHSDTMPMRTTAPSRTAFLAKPFTSASLVGAVGDLLM